MSYSVQSGESGESFSTVSSASFYSRDRLQKKWWYAANWSAAFCDSVEERFTCGEDKWANEFEDETLLTAEDTITVIEEVPSKDLIVKKVEEKKSKKVVEKKPKKVTEKKPKSPSLFAAYHNSKTNKKEENTVQKKEQEILNQFIQGNHRGWGKPTTQTRKKKTVQDYAMDEILVSDGSTFDGQSLEYASTYDSTFASSSESSYPDDEEEQAESSGDELLRSSGTTTKSMKIVGYDSRSAYSSDNNHSGRSGRTSRVSVASRNDTKRNSVRDISDRPDLERQSPSIGSRDSRQNNQYLKKPTRSFETQPTVSTGYSSQSSSSSTTMTTKSSFVTPQKMLSTYQSPPKTKSHSTTKASTKGSSSTRQRSSSKAAVGSHTMSLAQGMDKKIALGRNRATSRLIKEQVAKEKPKAFPYMVNHTLFHQNLESKKARAMARQRAGE